MKYFIPFILIVLYAQNLGAQDIPLFSQKLNNSFIYNPSFTGYDYGAISYLHRTGATKVDGTGALNLLSVEYPLASQHFGIGLNVFNEKINFINTNYLSLAFAYHLPMSSKMTLSMGVSGEYNMLNVDNELIVGDITDEELDKLRAGDFNNMDFSAGVSMRYGSYKLGVSANRLMSAFQDNRQNSILVQYFSLFTSGTWKVRDGLDHLDGIISYRKFTEASHLWDIGAFYTINDLIIVGSSLRFGGSNAFQSAQRRVINSISNTMAFKPISKLVLGYSMEIPLEASNRIGLMNEFTLRYLFNTQSFDDHFEMERRPSQFRGRRKRK